MASVDFVLHQDLGDARIDEVRAILRAHNVETNPAFMRELEASPATPLVVLGLTLQGSVAGGLIGATRGRWLKIDIMGVRPELRREGVGSEMLQAAEVAAAARGCDRVYLETMEHQAPAFYAACGYERRCELDDWDSHGHAKHIYVKQLRAAGKPGQPARGGA
jgi:GNAT superfamily N-acetyltransferase